MKLRRWFLAPSWFWLVALFAAPFAIVFGYSFLSRGPYGGVEQPLTAENYTRLFDPLYLTILLRSFLTAALATALCLVIAFPAALFIARSTRRRNLYLQLVMLPFWTSFLVRTYAWMFLLRETGLINTALQAVGLIREPLPLLYNNGAVLLGLVYGYVPFMVLPIYATLVKLDPALLEAAADLGCPPGRAFWRITVPLALPGIAAGSLLVFVPAVGEVVIPDLLGGINIPMLGRTLWTEFFNNRDWPLASAIAMIMLLLIAGPIVLLERVQARRRELRV